MNIQGHMPTERPELRAYEEALPDLMTRHQGQFVVIHGTTLARFFTDYGAALEWAYETYGLEPFFVKQVSEAENIAHFIRDLGPCLK